jgi:hypothetical protein
VKNVLLTGDWHCGHVGGLTPSSYWKGFLDSENPVLKKNAVIQKHIWEFWEKIATSKKWDVLLHLGDCIDGKGQKSGGNEQISTDRVDQIDMAVEAMKIAKAKKIMIIRGTKFHTGDTENFEDIIAKQVGAVIKNHGFCKIEDVSFDLKHKVGGSSIPHGRNTAILRSRLWSMLWAERGMAPNSNILARGHVHFYTINQDFKYTNIYCPCLQWGSEFGEQQCEQTIDLGAIEITCDKGHYNIIPHILDMSLMSIVPEML